jgi:hypothetical protein
VTIESLGVKASVSSSSSRAPRGLLERVSPGVFAALLIGTAVESGDGRVRAADLAESGGGALEK